MLTFTTVYLVRLYYPKWKAQWRHYVADTRRDAYGRWAKKQEWESSKPFAFSFS
ncbi:hypothetical protein GA0116948_103291 [Chitinophaga costaii]|uniref:Uncharacterized protein n=1 Tax=Chitinophaga costaii TaxID=1335309 RepID=A0A1C4BX39_9BACT|nr:hypothetical protein [Chitinophaga costaii]SCC11322.1 hypothetical protein GA0116948_103291 [Chitinophaga costaii]